MKRRVLIPIVLALALIVALTPAIMAAPLADTIIEANETVNNDVVVLDGNLEIHAGAVVNGDVAVFNGDALVDGQVNGNLTLFNGDLTAGPDGAIVGECVLLNGNATIDSTRNDVTTHCTAVQNLNVAPLAELAPFLRDFQNAPGLEFPDAPAQATPFPPVDPVPPVAPEMPEMPVMPVMPGTPSRGFGVRNAIASVSGVVASSLLFGFLALLTAAIMPEQLRRIVSAAREKSLVSGMAGALTAVAVPSLILLLIPVSIVLTFVCIGLLGFPIMFLLGLALVVGGFLGWIAVGTWLGLRLFGGGKGEHLKRSATLGTALLTFIVGVLGMVTFGVVGGLLTVVVSCIGLGAVALTQFGLKPYPRRPRASTSAPGGDSPDPAKVESVLNTLPTE